MDKIQILMSTYNGEKYLATQLDSILRQTYSNVSILIRDDGSSDSTVDILKSYAQKYSNIVYYQGPNVGPTQSFLDLLKHSDDEAVYYGFADQDDEWLPEKVERAITLLKQYCEDKPLLYCSDTYITDKDLNIIKKDDKQGRPSFGNALVQNICTGCTAVMNHQLRDLINSTQPRKIVMHDWWFYIGAALFGEVCYDDDAYIKYRQHGNNEFGAKTNRLDIWKYRISQLFRQRGELFDQLEEIQTNFGQMTDEQKRMLQEVLLSRRGLGNRLRLIKNKKIYRNKRNDDLVYRGSVLLGKL